MEVEVAVESVVAGGSTHLVRERAEHADVGVERQRQRRVEGSDRVELAARVEHRAELCHLLRARLLRCLEGGGGGGDAGDELLLPHKRLLHRFAGARAVELRPQRRVHFLVVVAVPLVGALDGEVPCEEVGNLGVARGARDQERGERRRRRRQRQRLFVLDGLD